MRARWSVAARLLARAARPGPLPARQLPPLASGDTPSSARTRRPIRCPSSRRSWPGRRLSRWVDLTTAPCRLALIVELTPSAGGTHWSEYRLDADDMTRLDGESVVVVSAVGSPSGDSPVPPAGFEPAISCVKGRRPRPLDHGGVAGPIVGRPWGRSEPVLGGQSHGIGDRGPERSGASGASAAPAPLTRQTRRRAGPARARSPPAHAS
jgi:hypothetical protein